MPSVPETQRALDIIAEDPNTDMAKAVKHKLGLDDNDIKAWSLARQRPQDDKMATEVKNKIYNRVADNMPVNQNRNGVVGFVDRFVLQNLIDRDPDLQIKYLNKKGYDAKVDSGQVLAKKPGASEWSAVDPKGFDMFDMFDIVGDTMEAVASSVVGTAAATLAAPTGPGAIAAGMGAGATTAAGFELGKQHLAKALGHREKIDSWRVIEQGVFGGVAPLAIGAAAKGLKMGAAKAISSTPSTPTTWPKRS